MHEHKVTGWQGAAVPPVLHRAAPPETLARNCVCATIMSTFPLHIRCVQGSEDGTEGDYPSRKVMALSLCPPLRVDRSRARPPH